MNKSENLNLGIPPLDDLSEDDVFTWVWETAAGSGVTLRLPCAPKHHHHHTSARFPLSHTTTCVPPYTLVPGHPVNCCPSVTKPFWWRWWGPWPKYQSVKSVYQFSIGTAGPKLDSSNITFYFKNTSLFVTSPCKYFCLFFQASEYSHKFCSDILQCYCCRVLGPFYKICSRESGHRPLFFQGM